MIRRATGLLLFAAVGCTKPTSHPEPKAVPPYRADTTSPTPTPTPTPTVPAAAPTKPTDADDFARQFLAAVNAGTATADQLTPEFKAVIAEPAGGDDAAKGYSDDRAARWLAEFKGRTPPPDVAGSSQPDAFFLVGSAKGSSLVCLRAVPTPAGWRVDWLSATPAQPAAGVALGAEAFAATAFAAALVANEDRLAEGLLAPAYRASLAPPFSSDKRGYNRGILEGKLAGWRGGATGFTLGSVAGGTAAVELTGGGPARRLTLKLVAGPRPGNRFIESVTIE